ncbi:Serine/threonine-protein phosphatase 7 long form homolog [Linum perenne]
MVERWHPKTNTFHLYHDEAIITLEDIHFITGLTVDGLAVTSATLIPTESEKLQDYVQNLLEKRPTMSDLSSGRIKMTWLRSNFAYCKGAIRDDDIETYISIVVPTSWTSLAIVSSPIAQERMLTSSSSLCLRTLIMLDIMRGRAAALSWLYRELGRIPEVPKKHGFIEHEGGENSNMAVSLIYRW